MKVVAGSRRRGAGNDDRILDAGLHLVMELGVDRIGLREVAARAGLSHGALYARYDHAADLLVDLWDRRLGGQLAEAVRVAARLAHRRPDPVIDRRWMRPLPDEFIAAVEVLVASRRIAELGDIVPRELAASMGQAGIVGRTADGGSDVAALGMLGLLLGTAMVARIHSNAWNQLGIAVAAFDRGAADRVHEGPAPTPLAPSALTFDSGDGLRDRLCEACVAVIARSGMTRTTLKRVGRVAGVSATSVYVAYDSREQMLADVVAGAAIQSEQRSGEFMAGTFAEVGAAASSALLAGLAQPGAALRRGLLLETYLAAHHDPAVASALAHGGDVHVGDTPDLPRIRLRPSDLPDVGRTVAVGVSLLADVLPLEALDWRPFAHALLGAFDIETAGPV